MKKRVRPLSQLWPVRSTDLHNLVRLEPFYIPAWQLHPDHLVAPERAGGALPHLEGKKFGEADCRRLAKADAMLKHPLAPEQQGQVD